MRRLLTATALTIFPTTQLFAHEGHGHTPAGQGNLLWHYVSEPQHSWVFATLIVLTATALAYRTLARLERAQ